MNAAVGHFDITFPLIFIARTLHMRAASLVPLFVMMMEPCSPP